MCLAIVYVVWGSTYLAIGVAVETIPPFLMGAVRFLTAGGLLFAWSVRRGGAATDRLGSRQWAATALVGGLLLVCGNGGVAWAEQSVASGVAALIIATIPIWMAVVAALVSHERMGWGSVAGLGIGFAGTVVLVRSAGGVGGSVDLTGAAVLVGAAICWATGSVLSRRVPLPHRPLVATAMEMICAGALLLIVSLASGEPGRVELDDVSLASLLGLLYLIVLGSWVAFTAYVWLLSHASTGVVSTYAYVNPVLAVFLGWSILGERVTAVTLVAAALIISAVVLIMTMEARRRRLDVRAGPSDAPAVPAPGVQQRSAGRPDFAGAEDVSLD
jgi:drug/metabolite transporter (DMT)-like permease